MEYKLTMTLLFISFLSMGVKVYSSDEYYQVGLASWYGAKLHGKQTASGEYFDMHGYTAAHKSLPIGTIVRVINLKNGKEVIVRVNDRGPLKKRRIIDLSHAAAKAIGLIRTGVAKVRIEVLSVN